MQYDLAMLHSRSPKAGYGFRYAERRTKQGRRVFLGMFGFLRERPALPLQWAGGRSEESDYVRFPVGSVPIGSLRAVLYSERLLDAPLFFRNTHSGYFPKGMPVFCDREVDVGDQVECRRKRKRCRQKAASSPRDARLNLSVLAPLLIYMM